MWVRVDSYAGLDPTRKGYALLKEEMEWTKHHNDEYLHLLLEEIRKATSESTGI